MHTRQRTYTDTHTRQTKQKGHVAPHQTNVISHSGRVDHILRVDKATPATQILMSHRQSHIQSDQAVPHPVRTRQSHIQSGQAVAHPVSISRQKNGKSSIYEVHLTSRVQTV